MNERVCECCERDQSPEEPGWVITRDGEDFCPECAESLAGALQEMIAKLPRRIGLCPEHAQDSYYPLDEGEGLTCPQCSLEMVVYVAAPAADEGEPQA